MRAAVFFWALRGNIFTFVKEKLNLFLLQYSVVKKRSRSVPRIPRYNPRLAFPRIRVLPVRGYPLRHEASAGEKTFFSAYLSHFTAENSGQFPGSGLFRSPGRKKNGRKRTHLPSVRGSSRQMVRPGGVEPSTKSLEGSCSIQLSYGRTAVRLLTIDTVLRSVSSAQTGCGTAPGAVQDRRKKG